MVRNPVEVEIQDRRAELHMPRAEIARKVKPPASQSIHSSEEVKAL